MKDIEFSTDNVLTIAGISKRQLDYWRSKKLFKPSIKDVLRETEENKRIYSLIDLIKIRLTKKIIDQSNVLNVNWNNILDLNKYIDSTDLNILSGKKIEYDNFAKITIKSIRDNFPMLDESTVSISMLGILNHIKIGIESLSNFKNKKIAIVYINQLIEEQLLIAA